MATAAPISDTEDTECCICNELYDIPKLLPCSHTVCRQCLLNWLQANPQGLCPMCRRVIADPIQQRGQTWQAVVDGLPTDLAMEAIVTSTRVLKKDHPCVRCRNSAAVSICMTCGDCFCKSCSGVHKNSSSTRDHKVEDLSTMTPERFAANQPAFCSFHGKKPAELFCPTHGASICQLCASSEHRSCPDVILFEKRVDQLRDELARMSTTLTTAEGELDNVIRKLDQQLVEVEKQAQKTMNNIDADFDRLENAVKACRRRLKEKALSGVAKVKDKVQAVKTTFLERKGGLTTHRVSVDRVKRAMPAKLLNDVNPTLKSKIEDLDLTAALPSDVEAVSATDLTIDLKALKQIEKELNNLDLGQTTQPSVVSSPVPAQAPPQRQQQPQGARPARDESVGDVQRQRQQQQLQVASPTASPEEWQFHSNHGKNISLSSNKQTATYTGDSFLGCDIAVASQPMEVNLIHEVQVDQRGDGWYSLCCGVALDSPSSLTLPHTAIGRDRAVVFGYGYVSDRGAEKKDEAIGYKLCQLSKGDRVGVLIDADGRLHLLINGSDVTSVSGVATPCFAFFQLSDLYRQVTTLPLRRIQVPRATSLAPWGGPFF